MLGQYSLSIYLTGLGVLMAALGVAMICAGVQGAGDDVRNMGVLLAFAGIGGVVGGVVMWPRARKKRPRPATVARVPTTISLSCPACDRRMRIKAELAGRKIKCPQCANVIAVPQLEMPDDEETAPQRRLPAAEHREGTLRTTSRPAADDLASAPAR
jgi:hypothetical protein